MYQAVSRDNDSNELKGFIQSQGARQSANEHLVPEQLFDDPNTTEKEVEGVSAVKAIQIAQEQGQTVYTITQDNYSQIIPKLSLSSGVMTDIRDNVAVGRTVTVHEKTINYKGWKGSGYIIIDPQTGSGAYLIDGGANGGYLIIGLLSLLTIIAAIVIGFEILIVAGTFSIFSIIFLATTAAAGLTLASSILTALTNDNGAICNFYKSAYASTVSGTIALFIAWFEGFAAAATAVGIEFLGNFIANNLTNNFLTCPSNASN